MNERSLIDTKNDQIEIRTSKERRKNTKKIVVPNNSTTLEEQKFKSIFEEKGRC